MIQLKVRMTLRGLDLKDEEEICLKLNCPDPIKMTIRPLRQEELRFGMKNGDCKCNVTEEVDPTPEVLAAMQGDCLENRATLIEYFWPHESKLYELSRSALEVLFWRRGGLGHPYPIRFSESSLWSNDGKRWNHVPTNITCSLKVGPAISGWTAEILSDCEAILSAKVRPGVAHHLLHEAWHMEADNPRSALAVGIAALESAVKQCIAILVPHAKWLTENVQSPPIVTILQKYLPNYLLIVLSRERYCRHLNGS